MKHSMQVAGIVVLAGLNVHAARDHRPADVTVYVEGDGAPPSVDYGARATVTWMYARIGVRLAWREGAVAASAASGSPVSIQVRFARDSPNGTTSYALAFALPFADGTTVINVMYQRVRMVAGRSAREQAILAHVLAHEIGHVLQVTNQHAQTGVMKTNWNGRDYDAMEKKPLEFTHDDIDLIVWGLTTRRAQTSGAEHGNEILRPPASGRK
jgi:hypothetical protein